MDEEHLTNSSVSNFGPKSDQVSGLTPITPVKHGYSDREKSAEKHDLVKSVRNSLIDVTKNSLPIQEPKKKRTTGAPLGEQMKKQGL